MSKTLNDPRIDPRLKAVFGGFEIAPLSNVSSREELLEIEYAPERLAANEGLTQFMNSFDDEAIIPSAGLRITRETIVSSPDGNRINLQIIRPDTDEVLPCVYYIHGGGMMYCSCFDGNYRAWGRMIAHQNVVVVMPDFRNALQPSSVSEIAPYPAGLNDCASGLEWVRDNAGAIGADPARIVIAGESGGGNLTLALALRLNKQGKSDSIKGVYALCPIIAGEWPHPDHPSTIENDGIFLNVANNRIVHAYGIEAWNARDPQAWHGMAEASDGQGLPPVVISVNECDPLRDEGIAFYRLLLQNNVPARARIILGTTHGTEVFPTICPEISRDAARDIAALARS